jgi:ribonuclease VapC
VIFVDSSAVVAILASEPDAASFVDKLDSEDVVISAGHVLLEASMRLAALLAIEPTVADKLVTRLFREAEVDVIPITEEIAHASVVAFERYGKGRRKSAGLNFGDCLSYACARAYDARLLFKGDDFLATDIKRA